MRGEWPEWSERTAPPCEPHSWLEARYEYQKMGLIKKWDSLALAAARIHWTIVRVILQLICALHALGLIVRSIADRIK